MTSSSESAPPPSEKPERIHKVRFAALVAGVAIVTALITALLTSIFQHKQEAKNPYIRFVNVTEETTDPAPWGVNWPREYDSYKLTSTTTRTRFGGHGGSEALPREKADETPWLSRAFAGYAFALDYRDRRGHAYMLSDQEMTKRVTERPQPGSCLHCHSAVIPTYRRVGSGDVMKGFEALCRLGYAQAHEEVLKTGSMNPTLEGAVQTLKHAAGAHPVSCVDCHDPASMQLRVTRPGFLRGIAALFAHRGKPDYDPNRDATRQEMRTYVCAQCHVEYYCGPKTTLFYPWNNGLKVEEIEAPTTPSASRPSRANPRAIGSTTGNTPRRAPSCSRPSIPSSSFTPRGSTPGRAWPARTVTCPTNARERPRSRITGFDRRS